MPRSYDKTKKQNKKAKRRILELMRRVLITAPRAITRLQNFLSLEKLRRALIHVRRFFVFSNTFE